MWGFVLGFVLALALMLLVLKLRSVGLDALDRLNEVLYTPGTASDNIGEIRQPEREVTDDDEPQSNDSPLHLHNVADQEDRAQMCAGASTDALGDAFSTTVDHA